MPDLIGINHGVFTSQGKDGVHNSFPQTMHQANRTGIATQEVELIDTVTYGIDIFNDYKTFAPREFAFNTLLSEMGGGATLEANLATWTDDYEGTDMVDIMLDHLRIRDLIGDGSAGSPGNPIAIGSANEIGGMLYFQKAKIGASAAAGRSDSFSSIADSQTITIEAPATRSLAKCSVLETGLIPDANDSDKKLLVLGFDRSNLGTGAAQYQDTVNRPFDVIRKIENVLGVRQYKIEDLTCSWNGASKQTISLKYDPTSSKSKQCHIAFDDLEIAKPSGANAPQEHKIQIIAAVDQFVFSADYTKFVLVLDFNDTNLDYASSGTIATGDITVPAGGGFYQVIMGEDLDCSSPSQTELNVGDVFFANAAATIESATGSGEAVMTVPYALLVEEVNTSVANTAAVTDRVFGANVNNNNPGGHSRLMRHIIISAHKDLPTVAHEAQGFGTEVRGGYVFSRESHMNFLEIHVADPWSITTLRQGTKVMFQDNFEISRQRHMKEYKQDWTNVYWRGKKSNKYTSNNEYEGSTSGVLDAEMFPMKYMKVPMPVTGNAIVISNGGLDFENWLEDLAKGLNSKNQVGDYQGHTIFVGITTLNMIAKANARIGSDTSTGGNIYGANFEMVPPSDMTLGLQVFKFKTMFGELNFVYEKSLDTETSFKVARWAFPNCNGKLNPRYTMLAVDKSFIEIMTHKSRPDKLYGNLQDNNNPFIYMEGMSGAHLLKMRFPRNHAIIDITPDI